MPLAVPLLVGPLNFAIPFAKNFHRGQLEANARFNSVTMSPSISAQIRLPFSHGGHGLTSLASTMHASNAASLIYAAPARLQGPQFPAVTQYQRFARTTLRVVHPNLPSFVQPAHFSMTETDLSCLEPSAILAPPDRINIFYFRRNKVRQRARTGKTPLGVVYQH